MCKILDCLHEYVPSADVPSEVVQDSGETTIHMDYKITKILLGGDLARAHGAKGMRVNHKNAKSCLKGIILVIEDWHTRLTLMKV